MILEILFLILNIILLGVNVFVIKKMIPKWEYYKDGIRFYNKKGKITIEHDKPLIK